MSLSWIEKFHFLDKIGAGSTPYFTALKSPEAEFEFRKLHFFKKITQTFNVWAFLFGGLWYFHKRMWLKGLSMLIWNCLFYSLTTLLEIAIGTPFPLAVSLAAGVVPGTLANVDYYRFIRNGETMWQNMPRFLSNTFLTCIVTAVILVLSINLAMLGPGMTIYVESRVHEGMTEQFKSKNVTIKSLVLTKKGWNQYDGMLETDEPNGEFIYTVHATSDGRSVVWQTTPASRK